MWWWLLLVTLATAKRAPSTQEPVIEEVTAKQLERILTDKDYVAVFWYARSCTTCDKVLQELEQIDDDTDSFGVDFVKINDKRLAKQYGITKFPALTYFREKQPIIYEGDLMDEDNVLDFLTSLEAMDLPDRIEEVNARILDKIVEETDFVAVLFCPDADKCAKSGGNKPDCKKCSKVLLELENIDDEADQLGIGFVKINDETLADEYNLGTLPALVYYRHQIPIIYEGELTKEEDVLEWLVQHKSTGDEDDIIEDVTLKTLTTLISSVDHLAVLFYDHGDEDSIQVLDDLEHIDDDCDKYGIQFVKIDDPHAAREFGLDSLPCVVYFEKGIPNVYDGDLEEEQDILDWLVEQLEKDEIEDVTDEMLDKLIAEGKTLAVLFYDSDDRKSQKVLNELENIDDECDKLGIVFVKIDNDDEAKEYGIEKIPSMVYFENGIPTLYEGNLEDEDKVLKWFEHQVKSDEIEDVTDEMLDIILNKRQFVAVLFYDKNQKKSQKVLVELENIDDECDQNNIVFVKIDNPDEAKEYGIDVIPSLVLFEKKIPHLYEGDLTKEEELLGWLLHQKRHSEIPDITDEMMDLLIDSQKYLAVLFYDKDDKQDIRVLNELENIDDDLEKEGIVIVRIDNDAEAKEFGIDHLPTLVYFEDKIPSIYEGDLMNEEEVLKWLIEQKQTATIEEVTDEILEDLIQEHEYVVVYFSGNCEEGQECDDILRDLENIDDELDENGIIFVTTEDLVVAKKYGIKSFPKLVFFRNKDPLVYTGDLEDEDEVLAWLTDENTLEIPDRIEEVNSKMLDKILSENEHVVVYFYKEGDKRSQKILQELENIDDECEDKDIDFVKISDEGIQKEYDLPSLPAVVFYRNRFREIYTGDLMHEEAILDWILKLRESDPDIIENVDRKTLQVLINDVEHLAVLFYSNECEECSEILEELETIDDDTDKHGIQFVKSMDAKLASEIGIFSFPALVYYETGVPIMYDGNLLDETEVLEWMVDQKNDQSIEEINRDKLFTYIDTKEFLAVVFYSSDCKQCPRVLAEVEHIDDEADSAGINFVKIEDKQMAKELGVFALPAILFFKIGSKEPVIYAGDLFDEHQILQWLLTQKDPSGDVIEAREGSELITLIDNEEALAVYFWNKTLCEMCSEQQDQQQRTRKVPKKGSEEDNETRVDDDDTCEQCVTILEELENIDDDCERHGIKFVKTQDLRIAEQYGATDYPVLMYFENGIGGVFEGDLEEEEEVLQWLIQQRTEDRIELITRVMLEKMVEDTQYLAVYFYKQNCHICEEILEELEQVDDECDVYGIHLVRIQDPQLAKRYSIKTFPALVYFRNGNPLLFEGDLQNEQSVLEWLIDDDNRELEDQIESVNERMLSRLLNESPFLAVFFYDEDCPECDNILENLEEIDGEADLFGIDFVKICSANAAAEQGLHTLPALMYFRKKKPMVYDGDLTQADRVLDWLTSQDVFEIKNEIEEVNKKMLEKLLEENEYVTVFFYEINSEDSKSILEKLENIDSETDNFDITFVKMADARYARKWGVTNLPAIVYFRRRFPSIYRGDLHSEADVLEWLRKNRFRQPELNLFMYALMAIIVAFIIYTAFLLQCFKTTPTTTVVTHTKQS
ncbi:hulk isoform X5 [Leptinotarsa decemlineata]|uniref:hulk isoform X5 n=1 Tax=Leptinotarsa decemlineata TaxID=7539 RepID=UPI003D30901F